jgi:hypothetical protein
MPEVSLIFKPGKAFLDHRMPYLALGKHSYFAES